MTLHRVETRIEVILELVELVILCNTVESVSLGGVNNVALDLLAVAFSGAISRNLQFNHEGGHSQGQSRHRGMFLNLPSGGHGLRRGELFIGLGVVGQDLADQGVRTALHGLLFLLLLHALLPVLFFGLSVAPQLVDLRASLCCRNHFSYYKIS